MKLTHAWLVAVLMLLGGCDVAQAPNEIVVQRFFGMCESQYGDRTDPTTVEGECAIMTAMLNQFAGRNPQYRIRVRPVAWPGYEQLSAQLAAGDPPDIVTMHESAIVDYQSRGLLEPIDDLLRAAEVSPEQFTEASTRGVIKNGKVYGLPFDTWAPLWHVNLNHFRRAGLMAGDAALLPRSPEELIEHARQFKRTTGKPYLVQSQVNERAMYARNLYTFLFQQNVDFFPNPHRVQLRSAEARRVVEMFQTLYREDLTTKDQDYGAATKAFLNGAGGVYLVGTWVIGDFTLESRRAGRPLFDGYAVYTYPQLFPGRDANFADGHAWVVPVRSRTPAQREAIASFLRYFAENNFEWARTGHLPAFTSIVEDARFQALPHRNTIAKLARVGTPLPSAVARQFAIQDIIGEEVAAAIAGQKSIDAALGDAEDRVNDLLFHVAGIGGGA